MRSPSSRASPRARTRARAESRAPVGEKWVVISHGRPFDAGSRSRWSKEGPGSLQPWAPGWSLRARDLMSARQVSRPCGLWTRPRGSLPSRARPRRWKARRTSSASARTGALGSRTRWARAEPGCTRARRLYKSALACSRACMRCPPVAWFSPARALPMRPARARARTYTRRNAAAMARAASSARCARAALRERLRLAHSSSPSRRASRSSSSRGSPAAPSRRQARTPFCAAWMRTQLTRCARRVRLPRAACRRHGLRRSRAPRRQMSAAARRACSCSCLPPPPAPTTQVCAAAAQNVAATGRRSGNAADGGPEKGARRGSVPGWRRARAQHAARARRGGCWRRRRWARRGSRR